MGEELFEKCMEDMVSGDKQGLRMIYEAYAGYVYMVVYGILGNKENAEDVTSDFLYGSGKRRDSTDRETAIKDIWQRWPGICRSII